MAELACGRFRLPLTRPLVMGVVNVTPDSFSDGGRFLDPAAAVGHAEALLEEGADLIDVGGESTRPGATAVPGEEQIRRLLPVLRALVAHGAPVSVDTRRPDVMRVVLAEGAAMINDVTALSAPGALAELARSDAAVCLMHMRGEPGTMQDAPQYDDIVREVAEFLRQRAQACVKAGIGPERIVVDPGIGFGKTLEHNLTLVGRLATIGALGYPVLVGLSRKSMLGTLTGRAAGERLPASLAAALAAVANGASIVRVHDVRETVDALAVWEACRRGAPPGQAQHGRE